MGALGKPLNRIDGPRKVTGRANYAADNAPARLTHAYGVVSPIASGSITALDASAAERAPGVLAVFHHRNIPRLHRCEEDMEEGLKAAEVRTPFEDETIYYAGQLVAVVIAETFEQARWAARLVHVDYRATAHVLTLDQGKERHAATELEDERVQRGDAEHALAKCAVHVDRTYVTPCEVHAAMELHSTIARWEEGSLILDDSTQWVFGQPRTLAHVLGISPEQVRVHAPFVGGGFGSKLFLWPHCVLAAVASREIGRPVKFVLPRSYHFSSAGHRPVTRQRVRLGATGEGKLVAIRHDIESHTSLVTEYVESCGDTTGSLYHCPHVAVTHRLIPVNVGTPTSMRGPGACPGLFALESALDELAWALRLDPVELRLRNLPPRDEAVNRPWSSCHFEDCIRIAAERFGWSRRDPGIGTMTDGRETLGWGFAAASWPAHRALASARVELLADGTARVSCGTQDIGTGTYTVLAQVVAELTGLPFDRIEVKIGDSSLPRGPISGGSMATASVVPAVVQATRQALDQLTGFSPTRPESLGEAVAKMPAQRVVGEATTEPGAETKRYSFRSFGAHCVEVRWDPDISRLRVARIVTVIDAGRIINHKTARNQIEGALIMGVGMARTEAAVFDPATGRIVNDNLADYLMMVNADTPEMDVTLLDRPDPHIGDLGAKGLGEIGITGIAAAIASATFHATGLRVRELPLSIEHLLAEVPETTHSPKV